MSETVAPGAKRTMMEGPSLLLWEAKVNPLAVRFFNLILGVPRTVG